MGLHSISDQDWQAAGGLLPIDPTPGNIRVPSRERPSAAFTAAWIAAAELPGFDSVAWAASVDADGHPLTRSI